MSAYTFCMILKSMIPTNTPEPIPTTSASMNGTRCSANSVTPPAETFFEMSSIKNGSITVSGVLNMLSSFNIVNTRNFCVNAKTASGPVPVIIAAKSRLVQKSSFNR